MNDETQAIPTDKAHTFAAAPLLRQDKPDAAEPMSPDKVTSGYAGELLRELGELATDQLHAAPRAASVLAADEMAWSARWRQAVHAVELCQRAAEIAARR